MVGFLEGLNDVSGIYKISNKINKKIYIGKSVNVNKRLKQHFYELKQNEHANKFLQKDFDCFGERAFEVAVLKECPIDQLDIYESVYCFENDVWNRKKGYNIAKLKNIKNVNTKEIQLKNTFLELIANNKKLTEIINVYETVKLPLWKLSEMTNTDEILVKNILKKITREDECLYNRTFNISYFVTETLVSIQTKDKDKKDSRTRLEMLEAMFA